MRQMLEDESDKDVVGIVAFRAGAGAFKNRFCAVAQFAGLGVELQNFLARGGVYA